MRIISGNFKGKKILLPKDKLTRPLKDLTKESIFNILKHSKLLNIELENSNILDLFSGVGSFGLECLSRGARNITFLESYTEVLNILKKNIDNLKIIMRSIFLQSSTNLPTNIREQIEALNQLVVEYCVKQIYSEAQSYINYKHDVSTMYTPIDRPVQADYNNKTLELKHWF